MRPGGNIPKWMDDALMNSAPDACALLARLRRDKRLHTRGPSAMRRWWQDTRSDRAQAHSVIVLRDAEFTPLISRSAANRGRSEPRRSEAAAQVVQQLKKPDRDRSSAIIGEPASPLPKIFNALYRPNPNFTGRFEAMESLQTVAARAGNAAITAVAGMGGVGKTTLGGGILPPLRLAICAECGGCRAEQESSVAVRSR